MEINITDYLSDDDIREIAAGEIRRSVELYMRDENNFKRIITNAAYGIVWDKVDEVGGETIEDYLPAKVREIIEKLTAFDIFKKPNAWDRETNSGYQILERCLIENKPLISEKVVQAINTAPKGYLRGVSKDAFEKIIERAITGK